MLNIQTLKQYLLLGWLTILRLRDIRFAGQVLFVIIVLLVSWSGVKTIDANYQLQKQIAIQEQKNALQQLENDNLRLQNQYFNSDQYLELSARQNFGLGRAGETEVIVPQNVAMAYVTTVPQPAVPKPNAEPPVYQRNIQAWVNFLLHRQSSTEQ